MIENFHHIDLSKFKGEYAYLASLWVENLNHG